MNAILELDEDDPDRFYLSGGLKNILEVILSSVLSIILMVILFFIWIWVTLREHVVRNMVKYALSCITKIKP